METQNECNEKMIKLLELHHFLEVVDRDENGNPLKIGNPAYPTPDKMRLAENIEDFEEIYYRELKKVGSNIINISSYITRCKKRINDKIENYEKTQDKYDYKQDDKLLDLADSYVIFLDSKILNQQNLVVSVTVPTHENKHPKYFTNNGFKLFEYILNHHIAEKRGRINDISFYYWKMFEDNFIIQRPFPFVEWFAQLYQVDNFQIKPLTTTQNPNRLKHYSNSLDWFKPQNQ